MAAKHPMLAVVIPLFNSARTAAAAIRSVQTQEIDELSIVVVNDGSTDDGPRLVEEMAREDGRITLISQANKGLAGARNTGLVHALDRGAAFVHFLDADDWILPGAYSALLDAATETGASYGGYALADDDGGSLGRESPISAPYVGLDEELEWNRAATHARLLSREAIGDDRFDESLNVCEDYDLWLRLETRGVRFKAVERMVCAYRLRPTSLSKQFGPMCRVYEDVTRRAFDRAIAGGWLERVDLSERRLRRVVGHSAMMYATMEALLDSIPSKPRAAALLEGAAHPARFTPAELAQAACTALLFGACMAPIVDGFREKRWLTALRQWWVRCAEEGWIGFEGIEPAMHELSRKVVHPDAVAASMLHATERSGHAREQGLVIVGLDKNGRRLARLAAAKGWRVLALDDFSNAAECRLLESLGGTIVVRAAQDFARSVATGFAGAPWVTGIVTPDAEATVARVAREAGTRPLRTEIWNDHRERLGAENLAHMQAAIRSPTALAG